MACLAGGLSTGLRLSDPIRAIKPVRSNNGTTDVVADDGSDAHSCRRRLVDPTASRDHESVVHIAAAPTDSPVHVGTTTAAAIIRSGSDLAATAGVGSAVTDSIIPSTHVATIANGTTNDAATSN
jgi:hypothetical protein